MKDFVPWVPPESSRPPDLEEEEDEEEMTGLLDRYAAMKWKWREGFEREPDQAEGSNWHITDMDSEMHAIVILVSPEMGLINQPGSEDVTLREPRGVTLIPPSLQVIHPLDWAESQMDMPKPVRTGRKRLLLPDRMLLNSYLPSRDPVPAIEEVTVRGPEDIKHIIHR